MTEQEFDQQVWRRFDVVTTDTGIETTVMNVCFSTRSVRIYIKGAPPEWLPCKRSEKHTPRKGDIADEGAIIEELHNKVMAQAEQIDKLKAEKQALTDKISKNYLGDLLRAINIVKEGLQEKKAKITKIDNGLNLLQQALEKINNDEQ